MHAVRDLIVELAMYENAPEEVTLTLDKLVQDADRAALRSPESHEEGIVGMAHHPRYSTWKGRTWHLEDLVGPRPGVVVALEKRCFTRWLEGPSKPAPSDLNASADWNESAIGFYKHLQASVEHTWLNGRLTRAQLNPCRLATPTRTSHDVHCAQIWWRFRP